MLKHQCFTNGAVIFSSGFGGASLSRMNPEPISTWGVGMKFDFRRRLLAGETLIGPLLTFAEPAIAEIMVATGYDWLFIDSEHGAFDAQGMLPLLQACGDCPAVIRVPANEDVWIKKSLDIGAAGIIVPQVNSAADAARALASCKYPPQGKRGVGIGRAHAYGIAFQEYMDTANTELAVIIQAEHIEAVEHIDSICDVAGIDAVLIGPYDLSASMGHTGEVTHPEVIAAISRVRDCCLEKGIRLGIFGISAAAVSPYLAQGFSLITLGVDALMLGKSAADLLAELRPDQASIKP